MSAGAVTRAALLGALKLAILAVAVRLLCVAGLEVVEANLPSGKDLCDRIQPGMTVEQIETGTRTFEGWQMLRDDGVMVISAHSYRAQSPVCRITIGPGTHRAISKSLGPIQQGDLPTL